MKKAIPIIIFLVFLVIVPILTWLNLRKGLDYRLDTKRELIAKDSISLQADSLRLFFGKTNIVITKPFQRIKDFELSVDQHFGNENTVNLYTLDSIQNDIKVLPTGYLGVLTEKYADKTFILIDTAGYIRNTYNGSNDNISKLLEHTSVIIPVKKRGSIEFKSNNQ